MFPILHKILHCQWYTKMVLKVAVKGNQQFLTLGNWFWGWELVTSCITMSRTNKDLNTNLNHTTDLNNLTINHNTNTNHLDQFTITNQVMVMASR